MFVKSIEYHNFSDIFKPLILKILIFFLGAGVVGILYLRFMIIFIIMQLKTNKSARQKC